jgi:membrane protease YdiL (CAAX protease family)
LDEAVESETGEAKSWRRVLDFPLVSLIIAVALFIAAAWAGDAIGSALSPGLAPLNMLARNAVLLAAVLAVYKLAIRRLGTMPRDDLALKHALPNLGIGVLIGFLLMAASVAVAAIAGVYHPIGEGDSSQLEHELITTAIMPAFMEEMLFRGILFRWIEEFAGSWAALLITALLFGLVHIMNPGATWFSSLAIAIEAGLLLGGAYMLTRSLWLPIGLHAAWNFTQGEVFDVPVSGYAEHGLIQAKLAGPAILSGGQFGLEASIIALMVAAIAGLWFLWRAVRAGEIVEPWWTRRRSN